MKFAILISAVVLTSFVETRYRREDPIECASNLRDKMKSLCKHESDMFACFSDFSIEPDRFIENATAVCCYQHREQCTPSFLLDFCCTGTDCAKKCTQNSAASNFLGSFPPAQRNAKFQELIRVVKSPGVRV
ncbi:hypothetical protein QR680_000492 [Steinernema hermaphroditum]|uniref:WAP domain-containing protein n=1 Tax=Steinernema hermaphroditum TaxID=289476 RepID=A0AA39LE72_9BILA|nr:hypothetical protein QR680_000492 [Steinernema hermaphroditum]